MPANPYAPPDAELGTGGPEPPPLRIGWKIFFFALAGLTLLSVPLVYFSTMQIQLADAAGFASGLVTLAGLYGFAFHRALGARRFWAVWLPLLVAWDAIFQFALVPAGLAEHDPSEAPYGTAELVFVYSMVYLLYLPIYIALYRYAYRSPELWRAR